MKFFLSTLCLASLGIASAATFTQTYSVPLQFNGSVATLTIQKFNPAWGTLTGVRVRTFARISGSVTLENPNSAVVPYAGVHSVGFGVNVYTTTIGGDYYLQFNPLTTRNRGIRMGAFDGVSDFLGTSSTSYSYSGTATISNNYNDAFLFSHLTGAGTVDIKLSGGFQSNWSWLTPTGVSDPNVLIGGSGAQSVVVTYEYVGP